MRSPVALVLPILLFPALFPAMTFAGPHDGGILIPHVNPSISYTSAVTDYSGQSNLSECGSAVVQGQVDSEKAQVWYVTACFADPPGRVSLAGFSFGLGSFDDGRMSFVSWGDCLGYGAGCDILEIPSAGWPGANTGVSVALVEAGPGASGEVVELYWFASYVYSAVTVPIGLNPMTDRAGFLDSSTPQEYDEVADFGSMGFGQPGYNPSGTPSEPEGACCLWGLCDVLSLEDCEDQGGEYRGDFTVCFPDPCPQPIETSWGQLKQMYE
ncbi:MAG: hypothetical protein V1774_08460 [Candidatus Eisenbacteria bacterium]